MGMDFPIADLMGEDACYAWLVSSLHPGGLACPGCPSTDGSDAGRRAYPDNRAPVLDFKCRGCGRAFNAFTKRRACYGRYCASVADSRGAIGSVLDGATTTHKSALSALMTFNVQEFDEVPLRAA